MANVGETARQIYSTLVEFNRVEVPDLLRAKTSRIRPPVEYITHQPAEILRRHRPAAVAKGWKTASRPRTAKEMAISYKVVVERMIAGDSASFDRRLLVIALHRALYYLRQTLLQNALIYVGWPEGIWREINSIYAYASQNNVHHIRSNPTTARAATQPASRTCSSR